jgi:hypothetical protein
MTPIPFPEQTKSLAPSGQEYSSNVGSVRDLPVWTDGEQCVSCWRLSWRERLSAVFFGRVWCAVLSGGSQPPVFVEATRNYFKIP